MKRDKKAKFLRTSKGRKEKGREEKATDVEGAVA